MTTNIFQDFQQKKNNILQIAHKAREFGWIDVEREKNIIEKINNDILVLGVIGQMKCGKSTFLNAFVFGDNILPSATTPMTATLTVITFGEEKKIEIEFYTQEEWEEQKFQSQRDLNDVRGDEIEESKIKAARELVEKSINIPGKINDYLGKKITDKFDNLEDYVGVKGKFVSITKAVKIYYPLDYLKGVEIVDTPGFNDPIVSREERTKGFLNKADVVLLMLTANRAFDETDQTILFKNIRECGIGKILIGINKYDIPYGNGEFEEEIITSTKERIEVACEASGDKGLISLIKEKDPLLISAEMALMASLPMQEVLQKYRTSWENDCKTFGISSQTKMMEKSHFGDLVGAIKEIIEKDKIEVLLKKPYNAIRAFAISKKEKLETELNQVSVLIENLQKPDEELEERLEMLKHANKRLERKMEALDDDIKVSYSNLLRKGRIEMEDEIDNACKKIDKAIDNLGRYKDEKAIKNTWNSTLNYLQNKTLRRCIERINDEANRLISKEVREFCEESEELLSRYMDDFDVRDFIKRVRYTVDESLALEIDDIEGKVDYNKKEDPWIIRILDKMYKHTPPFKVERFLFGNSEMKRSLHREVEVIRNSFNLEIFLDALRTKKDHAIEHVYINIIDNFLLPLEKQLENILNNKSNKEENLQKAIENKTKLESELKEINDQFLKVFSK